MRSTKPAVLLHAVIAIAISLACGTIANADDQNSSGAAGSSFSALNGVPVNSGSGISNVWDWFADYKKSKNAGSTGSSSNGSGSTTSGGGSIGAGSSAGASSGSSGSAGSSGGSSSSGGGSSGGSQSGLPQNNYKGTSQGDIERYFLASPNGYFQRPDSSPLNGFGGMDMRTKGANGIPGSAVLTNGNIGGAEMLNAPLGATMSQFNPGQVPMGVAAQWQKHAGTTNGDLVSSASFMATSMMSAAEKVSREQDPANAVGPARAAAQAQGIDTANSLAALEINQAASALGFVQTYLNNFTVDPSNKWNKLRDSIFVPMAILLLLPGAILTQARATIAQGSPILGQVNPFEGLLRALIAIFMIPGTYLIVNYSIDLGNAFTNAISSEYTRQFGTNMYFDALCAHIRAFPVREPSENRNNFDLPTAVMGPLLGGTGPFAWFEGRMIENKIVDPALGINMVPMDRADEALGSEVIAARTAMFGTNAMLAGTWNVLCGFQMAYLYYLWFVGPIAAALWVWPMGQLRSALPNWIQGVVTLGFWSLFWNTTVLLMACFKGVDETGTVMMSALNFLAVGSVQYAFDFASLVSAAGQQAANMAQNMATQMAQAAQQGGAAAGGGGGGGGAQSAGGGASGGGSAEGAAGGARAGGGRGGAGMAAGASGGSQGRAQSGGKRGVGKHGLLGDRQEGMRTGNPGRFIQPPPITGAQQLGLAVPRDGAPKVQNACYDGPMAGGAHKDKEKALHDAHNALHAGETAKMSRDAHGNAQFDVKDANGHMSHFDADSARGKQLAAAFEDLGNPSMMGTFNDGRMFGLYDGQFGLIADADGKFTLDNGQRFDAADFSKFAELDNGKMVGLADDSMVPFLASKEDFASLFAPATGAQIMPALYEVESSTRGASAADELARTEFGGNDFVALPRDSALQRAMEQLPGGDEQNFMVRGGSNDQFAREIVNGDGQVLALQRDASGPLTTPDGRLALTGDGWETTHGHVALVPDQSGNLYSERGHLPYVAGTDSFQAPDGTLIGASRFAGEGGGELLGKIGTGTISGAEVAGLPQMDSQIQQALTPFAHEQIAGFVNGNDSTDYLRAAVNQNGEVLAKVGADGVLTSPDGTYRWNGTEWQQFPASQQLSDAQVNTAMHALPGVQSSEQVQIYSAMSGESFAREARSADGTLLAVAGESGVWHTPDGRLELGSNNFWHTTSGGVELAANDQGQLYSREGNLLYSSVSNSFSAGGASIPADQFTPAIASAVGHGTIDTSSLASASANPSEWSRIATIATVDQAAHSSYGAVGPVQFVDPVTQQCIPVSEFTGSRPVEAYAQTATGHFEKVAQWSDSERAWQSPSTAITYGAEGASTTYGHIPLTPANGGYVEQSTGYRFQETASGGYFAVDNMQISTSVPGGAGALSAYQQGTISAQELSRAAEGVYGATHSVAIASAISEAATISHGGHVRFETPTGQQFTSWEADRYKGAQAVAADGTVIARNDGTSWRSPDGAVTYGERGAVTTCGQIPLTATSNGGFASAATGDRYVPSSSVEHSYFQVGTNHVPVTAASETTLRAFHSGAGTVETQYSSPAATRFDTAPQSGWQTGSAAATPVVYNQPAETTYSSPSAQPSSHVRPAELNMQPGPQYTDAATTNHYAYNTVHQPKAHRIDVPETMSAGAPQSAPSVAPKAVPQARMTPPPIVVPAVRRQPAAKGNLPPMLANKPDEEQIVITPPPISGGLEHNMGPKQGGYQNMGSFGTPSKAGQKLLKDSYDDYARLCGLDEDEQEQHEPAVIGNLDTFANHAV